MKLPLYARAGIPEVWIVDANANEIAVWRDPSQDGYGAASCVPLGGTVTPQALPGVILRVSDFLG
ncbi:MAG TPA: Uma2 family endonuclease [Acetobacteraceae bacterium]|nr:Uma2 family endonuclease [Acetobacteraceae bacterium]